MKILTKYENRKIYDNESHKYLSHKQIGEIVKEGIDIKIINNKTGEDETLNVLTKVLMKFTVSKESLVTLIRG